MKGLRLVLAGVVGFVVSFGTAATFSGCGGDNQNGTQVKESAESKQENTRTSDAMKEAMQKQFGPKGATKAKSH
ncbi:hypothetical protein [Aquisphaera insulae]|uniref:hypothetical protein n=1 Tax=Aquisphaera insulae TaxID=2712864 RepID=UPI0013EB4F02|nr:hypothetical protein [Aquisphaera insulae]